MRRSNNKNGSFTLSLRVPGTSHKIAHYLIVRTPRGYKIKVSHASNVHILLTSYYANLFCRVFIRNSHPSVL